MAEERILKKIKAANMNPAAKEWVEDNKARIKKLLLDERSLWESFVDWVYESPTGRCVLAVMGSLLAFIPTILVAVAYFNIPTLRLIDSFNGGLRSWYLQKESQEGVKYALEHMSKSMRTKANEILEQHRQYMQKLDISPSLAQKAYARIQGVLENMPDHSPVKQCFMKRDIPKKSDDNLIFKGDWGSNKDIDEGEFNSQENVKTIIKFIQKSFDIGELQPSHYLSQACFYGGHVFGHAYGHYYCTLDSTNLEKIIAVDSQIALNKAKNFCEDLMNEKKNHENLGSFSVVSQPTSTAVNSYSEKDPPPQPLNDTIEYKKN